MTVGRVSELRLSDGGVAVDLLIDDEKKIPSGVRAEVHNRTNLISTGQVIEGRLPGVEQMLVTYPIVVAASYTVLPGDGTAHFGLAPNVNAPPPCTEGYEEASRRYPQNVGERRSPRHAHCSEDDNPSLAVRGSRHAPRSGRGVGPDGQPYTIGSTGGQQRLMGEGSWKWLLLHSLG